MFIEDQLAPKRCGFVKGKETLPLDEALGKYRAALDARNEIDPDFVIMARTDARGAVGGSLEDCIARLKAYKQAGVDMVYAEALQSMDELRAVRVKVEGPLFVTTKAIQPAPTFEQLREAGAASERALEDARAGLAAAEAAAQALAPSADAGAGGVLVLASPEDGIMGTLRVAPGQSVAAATPLFDIVPRDALWVRVQLYVGDLASVDVSRGALVRSLGTPSGTPGRPASAVTGPPTADPVAATRDLFFAVPNGDGALRPGERVEVELRLRQAERTRVVPWSAVVYDFDGGAWVYETTAPHVFVRRRVQVRRVEGDLAVLSSGPAAGASVVSQGAAELLGTELGNGK